MGSQVLKGDGPQTQKLIKTIQQLAKQISKKKKKTRSKSKKIPVLKDLQSAFKKPNKSKKTLNLITDTALLQKIKRKKSPRSPKMIDIFANRDTQNSILVQMPPSTTSNKSQACVQACSQKLYKPLSFKENNTPIKAFSPRQRQPLQIISQTRQSFLQQKNRLQNKYSKIQKIIQKQKKQTQLQKMKQQQLQQQQQLHMYNQGTKLTMHLKDHIINGIKNCNTQYSQYQRNKIIQVLQSPSVLSGIMQAIQTGVDQRNSLAQLDSIPKVDSHRAQPTLLQGAQTFRQRRKSQLQRQEIQQQIRFMAKQFSKNKLY